MLVSSSFRFRAVAEDSSNSGLFRFVWDDSLRSYYIVSDQVFPLSVYVLSLPDVGNYRMSNHSAVVEGVKQAVEIHPWDSQTKELIMPLWFHLVMKLNVSVSYVMVQDWDEYRELVESANNTIIVNTHDEYLPVPEDYTKEFWTDKIADFMLNHWGTWVHAGGYPLYRVWYQNGTEEVWGENGFKCLMSNIGKGNLTCYPPDRRPEAPEAPATFNLWAQQGIGINWFLCGEPIYGFWYSNPGYPINYQDFDGFYVGGIYSLIAPYESGAIIRYSQNQSAFNFGIYVHMGVWKFYDIGGIELRSERAIGFISTAAAIYSEFFCAADKLYGKAGDSATEAIQEAEKEDRTVGLTEAKSLFQNALDAFASGNYKLSAAYANQAKLTAETATAPSTLPQTIALIAMVVTSVSVGAYYKLNNKKNKKEVLEYAERKQQ